MAAAESGSLNHTLRLAALPERRTVWLRLQTTSSHLKRIEALTPQESVHQEFIPGLLNAGLLALIFFALAWAFLSWLRERDRVNGAFIIRHTIVWIYTGCCWMGCCRPWRRTSFTVGSSC